MFLGKGASEIYTDLQSAEGLDEFASVINGVAKPVGFTGFTFAHINPGVGLTMIDRRPPEWQKRYHEKAYAERDPLIIEALKNRLPFKWSDRVAPQSMEQRKFMSEAYDFGLREGYMIPVKSSTGEKAYLSLFSDRPDDVAEAVREFEADLKIFGLMVYSAYLQREDRPNNRIDLTVRERECLLWASRGKTVTDTAQIMDVSSNTIKAHIRHSIEKLGAVNKVHAVVRAIYLQLIAQ